VVHSASSAPSTREAAGRASGALASASRLCIP
jgi:hypothetical protein